MVVLAATSAIIDFYTNWHGFSPLGLDRKIYRSKLKKRIMEKNEKIAEILNDLIEINNDRVDGY
ncbi:MAG: hypothetical protein LH619_03180, partial [Chitinophagaceae bacterium]|nr:hypothetical protein [Chitinophagaceae bacterium]